MMERTDQPVAAVVKAAEVANKMFDLNVRMKLSPHMLAVREFYRITCAGQGMPTMVMNAASLIH